MKRRLISRIISILIFWVLLAACQSVSPSQAPTTIPPPATEFALPATSTSAPLPPTSTSTATSTLTSTPLPPTATESLTPSPTSVMPVEGATYKSDPVNGITIWFGVDETGTEINGLSIRIVSSDANFYLTKFEKIVLPILEGKFKLDEFPGVREFIFQGHFDTPETAKGRFVLKGGFSASVPPIDIEFVANAQ